jgi:pyrroloquinoline quinone biosynthesis protein B
LVFNVDEHHGRTEWLLEPVEGIRERRREVEAGQNALVAGNGAVILADIVGHRFDVAVLQFDLVAGALAGAEKRVTTYREQPTAGVASALERVPRSIGAEKRFLNDVVGIGFISGQGQRESVDVVEPRQCLLLETTVIFELFLGRHPAKASTFIGKWFPEIYDMRVVLLGTAAGGGFPQWNCFCPTCRVARETPARAHPRSQSSMAVSADGERWYLCNASPDVRDQLRWVMRGVVPAKGTYRHVPIQAVILTDAELDHTMGLALLREARALTVYATESVEHVIEHDSCLLPTTRAFADITVARLSLDAETTLPGGLTVEAFAVPGDAPRFARAATAGHTVGLVLRETATKKSVVFVPGCGAIDDRVRERLATADLVLFDGTFWVDNELIALGISTSTAREMGHVPISGPGGSLETLSAITPARRVYTHINNSNPILIEDSPERRAVIDAGLIVGTDGAEFLV